MQSRCCGIHSLHYRKHLTSALTIIYHVHAGLWSSSEDGMLVEGDSMQRDVVQGFIDAVSDILNPAMEKIT